jgi:hypothetical protein
MPTVHIRYQDAETREVVEVSREIRTEDLMASIDDTSPDFRLQAGVAEFGELLKGSYWAEDGSYGAVLALLQPLQSQLNDTAQVDEVVNLMQLAIRYSDQ